MLSAGVALAQTPSQNDAAAGYADGTANAVEADEDDGMDLGWIGLLGLAGLLGLRKKNEVRTQPNTTPNR